MKSEIQRKMYNLIIWKHDSVTNVTNDSFSQYIKLEFVPHIHEMSEHVFSFQA